MPRLLRLSSSSACAPLPPVLLFHLCSDQGQVEAHYSLAVYHAAGKGGVPRSEAEAVRLYRLAAAQGAAPTQQQ